MVINKKAIQVHKFVEALFVRTAFVGTNFAVSITLSEVITKTSIRLAKYLSFFQIHASGFQIESFFAHMIFSRVFTLTSTCIVITVLS